MASFRSRSRLAVTVILACFLTICWVLFQGNALIHLYRSATRPFGPAPSTSSRLNERCKGHRAPVKSIAIIGAGAAGASTAYHLRRFASPCQPLNLTIFERRHYVGGRSTTVHVHDNHEEPVELGASIFVGVNHILVQAAEELGLATSGEDRIALPPSAVGAELGIWDGTSFRFLFALDEPAWRLAARLLWQYGTSPLRVQALMRRTVDRFLSLYEEPVFPFASLTDAASQVDLLDVTGMTGAKYLVRNDINHAFAADIVQASTRVNYAQDLPQIHGLEAMVCMAADGGARSIDGGNWRIFAGMIAASEASLRLESEVQSIRRHADGGIILRANTSKEDLHFDHVVLAAPWGQADLTVQPGLANLPSKVDYVRLHVTLFASKYRIRPAFFGLAETEPAPKTILTTPPHNAGDPQRLPFFSISLLRAVNNTLASPPRVEFAYKIFSAAPLGQAFLASLLDIPLDVDSRDEKEKLLTWSHYKVWDAYPYLSPRTSFDGPEMRFGDGKGELYYTSGIESFISTMETSALMGRNVAKLLAEEFERQPWKEPFRVQAAGAELSDRGVGKTEL